MFFVVSTGMDEMGIGLSGKMEEQEVQHRRRRAFQQKVARTRLCPNRLAPVGTCPATVGESAFTGAEKLQQF